MVMIYYSKRFANFRSFMEETTPGAFTSDQASTTSYDGKTHPEVSLEFPTETKHGEVISVRAHGADYRIYVNGGITIDIPRKIYKGKYHRLPRHRTENHPGDMITAVFYKYKDPNKKNYGLKSFHIHQVR
jgi:hypothetical protein